MKESNLQYVDPLLVKVDPPVPDDWENTKDGEGGTTREEIGEGLKYLPQVEGKIAEGLGPDDFEKLRQSQKPDERALGDSYEMFYGNDPIEVTQKGDALVSDDGRHRLNLAQQDGIRKIPVHVSPSINDHELANNSYETANLPENGDPTKEKLNMPQHGENWRKGDDGLVAPQEAQELSKSPDIPPSSQQKDDNGSDAGSSAAKQDSVSQPQSDSPHSDKDSENLAEATPPQAEDKGQASDGANTNPLPNDSSSALQDPMDGSDAKQSQEKANGNEMTGAKNEGHPQSDEDKLRATRENLASLYG